MSERDTFDMFHRHDDRGRFGDNETRRTPARQRVTGASDIIDLELTFRQDRPMSIMVQKPDAPANGPWIPLPKSQIEYERKGGVSVTVSMPEWLAQEKGLI